MEFIKYKDKSFPFVFTWSAFKEWQAELSENEVEMFEHGCYLGFKYGAKKNGDKIGCYLGFKYGAKKNGDKIFKKEEMVDMFDDDSEFQAKTFEVFAKQMGKQKKILEAIQV
jgi:hypothetical protein